MFFFVFDGSDATLPLSPDVGFFVKPASGLQTAPYFLSGRTAFDAVFYSLYSTLKL